MRSPGSTVEDVFKRTRMDVLRGSNSKQAPLVLVHPGRGIHFFRACRERPVTPANRRLRQPRSGHTALGINPNQASSLYGRGLTKRRKGDSAGGDRDIDTAIDIQSDIVDEFFWYAVR
jgi:hypothetical protein